MSRVAQATIDLRERFDAFVAEFEAEFRTQATKENKSSERRMRALLRQFRERVYEPYRDATLRQDDGEQVPF